MSFGPSTKSVPVTSQATPLSQDYLKMLSGHLSSDAFGTGVGPLQQEAGTALRQFITSLQGQGGVSEGAQRLISGLEQESGQRTAEGAANLREQHGIAGQRFGTALGQGEAAFRSQAGSELDQLIGGIQEGARQYDTTQLLASIGQLFGQGQANVGQVADFASLGINPSDTIASPGLLSQLLSGGIQAGTEFIRNRPRGNTGFTPGMSPDGLSPEPIGGGPGMTPPRVIV
jgi:hypothetical protein